VDNSIVCVGMWTVLLRLTNWLYDLTFNDSAAI
jgi:hypothetical protein